MTRPSSHRQQVHEKDCSNCQHSHLVSNKLDLLCFLDSIVKSLAQIRDQGNVVNKPNKTPNDPPLVRR
jgi:hypothetical protein